MPKIEIVETPMPPLGEHVRLYEEAMRLVKPARVAGLAINTMDLDEAEARRAVESAENETGLPATDPSRFGTRPLLDALRKNGLNKVPLYRGIND